MRMDHKDLVDLDMKARDFSLSFEFFPPRTKQGRENLIDTCLELNRFHPRYFSVTFGAGGSEQDKTMRIVQDLRERGVRVAPHISCVGLTRDRIIDMIEHYIELGIKNLVLIRGDLPDSSEMLSGDFHYASDLVTFIRQHTDDHFHIKVAAYPEYHPQASDAISDLKHFKTKMEAGADCAITQYFFDSGSYFHFVESCCRLGIKQPIIPGIMPIGDYEKLVRFSNMCGAQIPTWIHKRITAYGDDQRSIRQFGIEVVTQLCQTLIQNGAPGIHFYTLNQLEPTRTIVQELDELVTNDDKIHTKQVEIQSISI
jgi:methylenetetrahydrofolate reductase (NADH)